MNNQKTEFEKKSEESAVIEFASLQCKYSLLNFKVIGFMMLFNILNILSFFLFKEVFLRS